MSKTTEYIIEKRNEDSNPFTVESFFNSFENHSGVVNLKPEDLEDLVGYYMGVGEKIMNGQTGICINIEKKNVTVVKCGGNDGGYTKSIFTLGELKHLVNIFTYVKQ